MSRLIDITGKRFGQWTVIGCAGRRNRAAMWKCRCSCGREFIRTGQSLRNGASTQCLNCANKEKGAKGITHGQSRVGKWTYLYRRWASMKRVCFNDNVKQFNHYGGRGIEMYGPWVNSFQQFRMDILETIGDRPSNAATLDRIDNDGNYEPGNLRWATMREQCRNRRSSRIIEFGGQSKSLVEWAEYLNISYGVLANRFRRGWAKSRALTTPAGPFVKRIRRCDLRDT